MSDKTDRLSALMDAELLDLDKGVEQLANDKEMQEVWRRYHIARDVMKGQTSEFITMDISNAVSKSLKNEPAILTPILDVSAAVSESLKSEPVVLSPLWRRLSPRYVMKQAAGLAVAAAVGTIAVLSVQQTQVTSPDSVIAAANTTAPTYQVAQQPLRIRQVSFTTRKKLDAAVESKLSGYLINHNEFSTSTRVSGVMPYTRIVSFVPSAQTK